MTERDLGVGGIWIQASLGSCPVSRSARGPALRFLDKKKVSVQQGSPFGHGWECYGIERIWRKESDKS